MTETAGIITTCNWTEENQITSFHVQCTHSGRISTADTAVVAVVLADVINRANNVGCPVGNGSALNIRVQVVGGADILLATYVIIRI